MPSGTTRSPHPLTAGAAAVDLTPQSPVFLYGYPHVPRQSTGVHDRLEAAALYLSDGTEHALFIANDLIFVSKGLAADVRRRISARTGIPAGAIMVTATHTHSGPVTVDYLSNGADATVPRADPAYLAFVAESIVLAGCSAVRNAVAAEIGLVVARAEGVGTNRHDPAGPADPEVPVLVVRSRTHGSPLAFMIVHAMHPTVLHEDSTLISGDFPHFTRECLREQHQLPASCVILYHNGASGDQSPRHVTTANTFAEARRIGRKLADCISAALPALVYTDRVPVASRHRLVGLALRDFPTEAVARGQARAACEHWQTLCREQAPRTQVRTAECAWFGAEETVELARAAADGRLQQVAAACAPMEIQVITIGPWQFVAWPGEFFVEYALEVKARSPHTHVITLANGELQGYLVTPAAVAAGAYEAGNAMFSAENGRKIVEATLALLAEGNRPPA